MKAILYSFGAAGIVVIAIAVPNAAIAFQGLHKSLGKYEKNQFCRSFNYLKRKKIVGIGKDGDRTIIKLLDKGKERVIKFRLEDLKLTPQKKWDEKFRLVFFDIPEKYRYSRQIFTSKLREIGFLPIQKSAWICPHPCDDEIEFLVSIYEIRPFVRIVTFSSREIERYWQEKFKLI